MIAKTTHHTGVAVGSEKREATFSSYAIFRAYATSWQIALFSATAPQHALLSDLTISAVSDSAQYTSRRKPIDKPLRNQVFCNSPVSLAGKLLSSSTSIA